MISRPQNPTLWIREPNIKHCVHSIQVLLIHLKRYDLARYALFQYCGGSTPCRYTILPLLEGFGSHEKRMSVTSITLRHDISISPNPQVGISGDKTSKLFWHLLNPVSVSAYVHCRYLDDSEVNGKDI